MNKGCKLKYLDANEGIGGSFSVSDIPSLSISSSNKCVKLESPIVTRFPPVLRSFLRSVDSLFTIRTVLISNGFSFGSIPVKPQDDVKKKKKVSFTLST